MNLAGFGLGLRTPHYEVMLNEPHDIDWLEVITENYLVPGGKPLDYLELIRERFPLVMHGVSLSIGSTAPLDRDYRIGYPIICAGPVSKDATCTIFFPCPTPRRRSPRWWPGSVKCRTPWGGRSCWKTSPAT